MASAQIEKEVDRLIDERPGRELLHMPDDDAAVRVHERIFRSTGTTASYLVDCGDERVIVTPHAAFTSVESVSDLRRRAARQIADVLTGKRPPDVVNGL